MKILLAPLNWGLGHATRCIPLVRQFLEQGDEVVLAGDGDSITLLRRHFPQLRFISLPSLELKYTNNNAQRGFYLKAIPTLSRFIIADHYYLDKLLAIEHFDIVVSDNRFGFFTRQTRCIYITHQLYLRLPKRLRIFQPIARAVHAWFYKKYDEVWVPDYADPVNNLAGGLCHGGKFDTLVKYIGPLSRFSPTDNSSKRYRKDTEGYTLAILSGLEPQRTIFEKQILNQAIKTGEHLILVQGLINRSTTNIKHGHVEIIPHLSDEALLQKMQQSNKIIARSGYSTIMDLAYLNLLDKAELHPTPGQSEQEYLAEKFKILKTS
jgi:uncharacterized protein (TIGR00661 family)